MKKVMHVCLVLAVAIIGCLAILAGVYGQGPDDLRAGLLLGGVLTMGGATNMLRLIEG